MLAGIFPFILFVCAILATVIEKILPNPGLMFLGFLISMIGIAVFRQKKMVAASEVFLLGVFIFLFSLWSFSHISPSLGSVCGQQREYRIKVLTIEERSSRFNVCWASAEGFSEKIKIIDYSRRLSYMNRYALLGKVCERRHDNAAHYLLHLKKGAPLVLIKMNPLEKAALSVSRYLLAGFRDNFSQRVYCFLSSLCLGRYELFKRERDIFINAGTTHLLAISGMHMALAAGVIFFIAGLLGASHRMRLAASSVLIFFYCFVTGLSPSSLRAGVMFFLFAVSFLFKRQCAGLNILGLAGLAAFFYDTSSLRSVGFQLSYLSVFALLIFPKIFFGRKEEGNRFSRWFEQSFNMSLWVSLFLLPLLAYYFGRVYFAAFLYNIILIPLCDFVMLLAFVLCLFMPLKIFTLPLTALLEVLARFFIELNHILGDFPLSFFMFKFTIGGVVLYYIIFMVALIFIYRYNKKYEKI